MPSNIKNILLIQPMHEKHHKKVRTSFNFPWGIAHLSTALQQAGYQVTFLDGQMLQLTKEELAPRIDVDSTDMIGFTAFSTQYASVKYLSAYIKQRRNIPIIVGGALATYQPEFILQTTDADVSVIGEGEITAVELLTKWNQLEHVKGIAYKRHGMVYRTMPQDAQVNLDELPMPDFSIFDMYKYCNQKNAYARKGTTGRTLSIITSRGCPYSCHFCSKSARTFQAMSPQKIYHILSYLKKEFGIDEFVFNDELFLLSKQRFCELAPYLKSLSVPWGAQARINVMDKEFLQVVKEAGCIGLGYGIESGSQKILNNMNKQITVAQIENIMRMTIQLKIPVKVQLIFGYPGEDEATVQETIELFRRIDHPGRRFNVIMPLPGSQLYGECLDKGLIPDEEAYLCSIERGGRRQVYVNFTPWPDEEIYPRKQAAEEAMYQNYINKSMIRKSRYYIRAVKQRIIQETKHVFYGRT